MPDPAFVGPHGSRAGRSDRPPLLLLHFKKHTGYRQSPKTEMICPTVRRTGGKLPPSGRHWDNTPRRPTTSLSLWQLGTTRHPVPQISWLCPSTTGKLLSSLVLKFYRKRRMETGWGLNTTENYSPCLGGWEDFIWADDENRKENKGWGEDQKDQEDIRRERESCVGAYGWEERHALVGAGKKSSGAGWKLQ